METTATMAMRLQELLGQRLVAFCVGVRSSKLIGRWATEEELPTQDQRRLILDLYAITEELRKVAGDSTIRAWFTGMNPDLGDEAPAEVFREGNRQSVRDAARTFATG
jgi:hypothetical protein